jgi:hypothetical protein
MDGMTEAVAAVLVLDEADYQYGVGRLRIRVEQVDRTNPISYDGGALVPVTGVQIGGNGAEVGRRQVLVRGRRLSSR